MEEKSPPTYVTVPEGEHAGIWIHDLPEDPDTRGRAMERILNHAISRSKDFRRALEIEAGRARHEGRIVQPVNLVRYADKRQWAFLLGLVICEMATRHRL